MSRAAARPNPAWKVRAREEAARGPWTPEEDARLADMAGCGLCTEYWTVGERSLGEMLERRRELAEAGIVSIPRPL